jgi:hypothetical protein
MTLYVNGDSHSAGAELIKDYCFAEDDPKYAELGRQAHPDAVPLTYGFKLAQALSAWLVPDAESASSNERILRTTQAHVDRMEAFFTQPNAIQDPDDLIVIGWSSWEREEWKDSSDNYIQVTASGTDSVPEEFGDRYKQWVINQTLDVVREKCKYWHDKIWDLHEQLDDKGMRHIFFNSYNHFDVDEPRDWGASYINPYEQSGTYYHWLQNQGFKTVKYGSQHYGEDGHDAWVKFLLTWLTSRTSSSIITNTKTVNPAQD